MSQFKFKSNLNQTLKAMGSAARETVNETAIEIASEAKSLAPKNTGALGKSIVALLEGRDSRAAQQAAESAAMGANPSIKFNDGMGLIDGSKDGIHRAAVEALADYAAIIHNGGGGRSGRPFLEEAGDGKSQEVERKLAQKLNQRFD